jgi:hypothetical protein
VSLQDRHAAVHEAIMKGPNAEMQKLIDTGDVWRFEGSVGRSAMEALEVGACVLPAEAHRDAYGSRVPSYLDLQDEVGSTGSVANAEGYLA